MRVNTFHRMTGWFPYTPAPPEWRLDWDTIHATFPWIQALAGCPQDPVHHAEGDVWIHTRMVCEALIALPAWRALSVEDRATVFAAALLHDVSKPETTRVEDGGRVTARHHSPKGAVRSRRLLWELGVPPHLREAVCGLVRFHQVPYFCIEADDPRRMLIRVSQVARSRLLAILCEADARGRICADPQRLLDNIALFYELAHEQGCLDQPWSFSSPHSRVLWFLNPQRDPDYAAYDDTRLEVVMMSGLPGTGKDTWLRRQRPGVPVVSLDQIRRALGVHPRDNQGTVVQLARERARVHLRAGQDFAWNATTLTRDTRRPLLRLFRDYNARVHIVCLEAHPVDHARQNREREAVVPQSVIDRMIRRWQAPDRREAHKITRTGWKAH